MGGGWDWGGRGQSKTRHLMEPLDHHLNPNIMVKNMAFFSVNVKKIVGRPDKNVLFFFFLTQTTSFIFHIL